MTTLLLAAGMTLVTLAALPYIRAVQQGRVRPRLVSWMVWAVLMTILTVTSIQAREVASAVLAAVGAVQCTLIVLIGWRIGSRYLGRLDVSSLVGAAIGLGVLLATNDLLMATIITVSVDAIAYLPTLKHAWDSPEEESLASFALSASGAWLCLASALLSGAAVEGIIYPVYSAVVGTVMVAILLYGRAVPYAEEAYEYGSD
jgi:hypothetical protein